MSDTKRAIADREDAKRPKPEPKKAKKKADAYVQPEVDTVDGEHAEG
jgi:hypothetical protein